jgi:4'-phosphopantetheinyl transferase
MPLDGLEPVAVVAVRLDLDQLELDRVAGFLSQDEVARADRLHRSADRARFIAGRGRLRQVLGRRLECDPASIRFAYSTGGKPSLAAPWDKAQLQLSFSGSEGLGLVALRVGAEVGVDIEAHRTIPDLDALAGHMLSGDEHTDYSRLREGARQRRFFASWVRKEALAKSLGSGLREGFDRLSFSPWPAGRTMRIDVLRGASTIAVWVSPLEIGELAYSAAVASTRPIRAIEFGWWNPQDAG